MLKQQANRTNRPSLRRLFTPTLVLIGSVTCVATPASAVILYDTATRNTAVPSGSAAEAWNLQGQFGTFLGTPIAPNLFLAAQHIGGSIGQAFTFDGRTYTTTAVRDIGGSDLRVWQIDTSSGGFDRFASLYDPNADGAETGKPLFVVGRGTARDTPYYADAGGTDLRGWRWGTFDGVQSWGENIVDGIVTDPDLGTFLAFDFDGDATRVANESALSSGDSSGGVFIFSRGAWRLAGVNYGVENGWSTDADGPYENAAIFDGRGLYLGDAASHELIPTTLAEPYAASSFSTQVSAYRDELNAIFLATGNPSLVPEPAAAVAFAGVVVACRRRRCRTTAATGC